MPGPLNCFTYCLLVYNLPPPPTHTRLQQAGPPRGLQSCNRPEKAVSTFSFELISSSPALAGGEDGESQTRGTKGPPSKATEEERQARLEGAACSPSSPAPDSSLYTASLYMKPSHVKRSNTWLYNACLALQCLSSMHWS